MKYYICNDCRNDEKANCFITKREGAKRYRRVFNTRMDIGKIEGTISPIVGCHIRQLKQLSEKRFKELLLMTKI